MEQPLYQVDAFADEIFQGNPAAVCPLSEWFDNLTLQQIAMENNLSETAYFVKQGPGTYHLRWFTPLKEVAICGHATLASAHILYEHMGEDAEVITFNTLSGELKVRKGGLGYIMDFPVDSLQEVSRKEILPILHINHGEIYQGKSDMLVVLDSEEQVQALNPDFQKMATLPVRGIIVTAPGKSCDFVSRCFYPSFGINEDPVTGSAHRTMMPYWTKRLGKNQLNARQLSRRQGNISCSLEGDRVMIEGNAVTYMKGSISLPEVAVG